MKTFAWLAILFAPTVCAADLVGSTIPPYPDGLTHSTSACIAASKLGPKKACNYSIGVLEGMNGKPTALYGARLVGRNDAGKATWRVTDAMPYPALPQGHALSIATCTNDGENDETIIAAVNVTDTEWYKSVLWARRYDINSGKFVDHPIAGLRCLNESWGL